MVGYVTQQRDLSKLVPGLAPSLMGAIPYYFQPSFGVGSESYFLSLISHQRTRSWRSGGAYGTQIEDFHQILANNVEQFNWPYDTGHEFNTLKVSDIVNSHEDYIVRNGYGNCYYRGPLLATDPTPFWAGHNSPDGHDRVTYTVPAVDITLGTKWLRSTLPGKAHANLSQAILELLIDLPRIPFERFDQKLYDRRNLPKNIGSEYLNTVFGWAPLVSDVLKVCAAIVKIDENLAQYQRDAGPDKTVRRRRVSDPIRTATHSVLNTNIKLGFPLGSNSQYPGLDLFKDPITGAFGTHANGQIGTRGTLTVETHTYEKYDFVARWMYFLGSDSPVFGRLRRYAQYARTLLGIRLDLELLWEIAPWTWMSDWFVNIGDVLAVQSAIATDSQVLQYAYLMHETEVSTKYTHSGVILAGHETGAIHSLITQRKKERVRATPYGFGVNLNALSAVQIAILASLVAGSRGGRQL